MAARVTSAEVIAITSDDIPSTVTDVDVFIGIATLDVDDFLGSTSLNAARLKNIELYLSAHYAIVKYKFTTSEKAGSVGAGNQHKEDLGWALTHYGQQAMALDSTGTLAKHNKAVINGGTTTPSLTWSGTEYPL